MMQEMQRQLRELQARLDNMVRVGEVSSRDTARHTVRVVLTERDNLVTHDLPVLSRQTLKNKSYRVPDVGEQVVCVFLPVGIEAGFVLGAIYSTEDVPPVNSGDVDHTTYDDGTVVEYDRGLHKLTADLGGSRLVMDRSQAVLTVQGVSLTVDSAGFHFAGGTIDHDGTVVGNKHTHSQPPDSDSNTQKETNPPS